MLRNVLTLMPALAFALPFVAAQSSMARPLTNEATPIEWGNKFDDDDDDKGQQLDLLMCTQTIVEIGGDGRAYECGVESGPACLSRCTAEAVAPNCATELALGVRAHDLVACQDDMVAACRSACEAGGANFCAPSDLQARWGKHPGFLDDDDDDRDDSGDDAFVYINTATCLELNLDDSGR